jgi:hypothetical protein
MVPHYSLAVKHNLPSRQDGLYWPPMASKPPKAVRDFFAKMGRKGGESRSQTLTPERRAEIARAGGLARAAKLKARP